MIDYYLKQFTNQVLTLEIAQGMGNDNTLVVQYSGLSKSEKL
jgi:hypothetical protein